MAKTIRWALQDVRDGGKRFPKGTKLHLYARATRQDIAVRIEIEGDTTKYAELGYPKLFGLGPSIAQAALEVRPENIRE